MSGLAPPRQQLHMLLAYATVGVVVEPCESFPLKHQVKEINIPIDVITCTQGVKEIVHHVSGHTYHTVADYVQRCSRHG